MARPSDYSRSLEPKNMEYVANMVREIAYYVLSRMPPGYEMVMGGTHLFPVYRFEQNGELIAAVRHCGAVNGIEADIMYPNSPVGIIMEEALKRHDIPLLMGNKAHSYQKPRMY